MKTKQQLILEINQLTITRDGVYGLAYNLGMDTSAGILKNLNDKIYTLRRELSSRFGVSFPLSQ